MFKLFCYTIIFSLLATYASAQSEIRIKDFSDKYYAKVVTKPDSQVYYIQVFEKTKKKRLIEVPADNISESLLENNELIPNVKELPYGDQSVLIYEDFNFDGVKDFALMNGYNSCYGGPSFDIYLWSAGGFRFSEKFSELSNEYCGMFHADPAQKKIFVMTKSGCCFHQYSEFVVKNNVPVVTKIVEETYLSSSKPMFVENVVQEWVNGEKKQTTQLMLPHGDVDTILTFRLKKNNKSVVLLAEDSVLFYTLIRTDESVEFYYPKVYYNEEKQEEIVDQLHYSAAKNTLSFKNKAAYYEIYESTGKIGIRGKNGEEIFDLEGDIKSLKGSLKNVSGGIYKNIQ